MFLGLKHDEVLFLASHLRRLTGWDERTAVRLQVRGETLGVYAAPPLGVLSLIVIPVADASGVPEEFDQVVSAARLRDIIGDVSRLSSSEVLSITIPDAVMGSPSLAMLPPRDGWFPPVTAMAGDLVGVIDESIAHLNQRTQGTVEPFTHQIAEEEWAKPGWAALPQRVLHSARQLGFLGHAGARIHASVNGTWKRLISPAGQVFVHVESPIPSLRVVR